MSDPTPKVTAVALATAVAAALAAYDERDADTIAADNAFAYEAIDALLPKDAAGLQELVLEGALVLATAAAIAHPDDPTRLLREVGEVAARLE